MQAKYLFNKKVLLCECKRHTDRHLSSTPSVNQSGLPPTVGVPPIQVPPGGTPDIPPVGVPPCPALTGGIPWKSPLGYPLPPSRSDRGCTPGTPHQGTSLSRSDGVYPQSGYPHPGLIGGYPLSSSDRGVPWVPPVRVPPPGLI